MKKTMVLLVVLISGIVLLAGCGKRKISTSDGSKSVSGGNESVSGGDDPDAVFKFSEALNNDDFSSKPSGTFPAGGDGMLNMNYDELVAKIKGLAVYWENNEGDKLTYELVLKTLGGVLGKFDEEWDDGVRYYWYAANNTGGANLTFVMTDGKLMYKSASYSPDMTKN